MGTIAGGRADEYLYQSGAVRHVERPKVEARNTLIESRFYPFGFVVPLCLSILRKEY